METLWRLLMLIWATLYQAPGSESYTTIRHNEALGGTATQSSTYAPWRSASMAVDGDTQMYGYYCSSTNLALDSWWSLHLARAVAVHAVTVTFGIFSPFPFMDTARLFLGNSSDADSPQNQFCQNLSIAKVVTVGTFVCSGAVASYVHFVQHVNTYTYMQLCEVQVSSVPLAPNESTRPGYDYTTLYTTR
ncbi:fucolectin-3-like [Petromyzon marinus]|uniref:fucolectin-3-like n=1 Tax=Petromyzon marinus TaxID=7757 RepID=UPI003F715410